MGSKMNPPQKGVTAQLLTMNLSTFVTASKVHENESLRLLLSTDTQYRACLNCQGHPGFLEIPPSTLHRGQECLICGSRK